MKRDSLILILGLSGAGLLFGLAARRLTQSPATVVTGSALVVTEVSSAEKNVGTRTSNPDEAMPLLVPAPPSTDTVEILLALDDASLYPRLAAWLLGAGEPDIVAYWDGYRTKENRENPIAELVFINWTRLNPAGAIAAVAGSEDDYLPWWAWTAHDPQAALAAVIATGSHRVGWVARGIGGFHPDWLREHLDQIPEKSRAKAFAGFSEWDDSEHPLESLKFMRKNSMGYDPKVFRNLALKDPWEALEWLKQNPSLQEDHYSSRESPLEVLVETMVRDYPDDLKRLAARTPSGAMKRKMEAAMFDSLLATDPAAAITQAKATDSTAIVEERFAKIGLSLLKTDPDQAFKMAMKLLVTNPAGSSPWLNVQHPSGFSSWNRGEGESSELLNALIAKDPARLMQVALDSSMDKSGHSVFANVAGMWANQNLVSYANWVVQQTDPGIRDSAVGPVISGLAELGQFDEAIEWARSSEKSKSAYLPNILDEWGRKDPAGATRWLETSDLPIETKASLQENINQASRQNNE